MNWTKAITVTIILIWVALNTYARIYTFAKMPGGKGVMWSIGTTTTVIAILAILLYRYINKK